MNRSRITGDLVSQNNIFVDIANDRVGIGSTIPGEKLSLPDSAKIALGDSADLKLYHNTSDYIQSSSQYFYIGGENVMLTNAAANEITLKAIQNGAVELYHDNSKKFETTSTGAQLPITNGGDGLEFFNSGDVYSEIVGNVNRTLGDKFLLSIAGKWNNNHSVAKIVIKTGDDTTNKDDGRISFFTAQTGGTLLERLEVTPLGHVNIYGDNKKLQIGGGQDLALYHDGTNSRIHNTATGSLIIRNEVQDADIGIQGNDGGSNISMLSFDASESGNASFSGNIKLTDTKFLQLGQSNDLSLTHTFINNSFNGVINNATNTLFIESDSITIRDKSGEGGETYAQLVKNGAVSLRHDNNLRFATTAYGIDVTGTTNTDGLVVSGVTTTTGNVNVGDDLDVTDDLTIGGEFNMQGSADNNKYIDARIGSSNSLIFRSSSGGAGNLVTMLQLGVSGSSLTGNFALGDSSDSSSAAGPEFTLNRNSSSPANADYLGQIKFAGRSSTGVQRNYAKITGKILDVTNGSEDGIIEFAHIKAGSQVITGRWRSDSLQLLNSTNLSVAGSITATGTIYANETGDAKGIRIHSNGGISATNNELRFNTGQSNGFTFMANSDGGSSSERLRITSDGQIGVNNTSPDAWYSTYRSIQIYDGAVLYGSADDSFVGLGANHFLNTSGDFKYSNTDFASRFYQVNGGFHFESAASGTAGNTFSFTERLRITSGGNVNIGTSELDQTVSGRLLNVYGGQIRARQTSSGNTLEAFGHTTSGQSYGLLVNAGTTANDYAATFRNSGGTTMFRVRGDGSVRVGDNSSFSAHTAADNLVVGTTSGSHGMTLLTGSATGNIFFNDGSGNDGVVQYVHSSSPNYMRIASSGYIRLDASAVSISDDNINPTAGDMATGASFGVPRLHMRGNNSQSGAYELLARFQSGIDANDSGATIVLNHSNDRGLALQGGRGQSNRSFGAIKAIDNLGRLSNCIDFLGGNGQGVNYIRFFTGESTTTTERLKIDASGRIGVNTSSPIGTLDVYDGTFVLSKPNASGNERNWRFVNNNVAAGNLGLQVSTAAGGSSFSNVIEITRAGRVGVNESSNINGRLHVQHDAASENILYATRFNDQSNDKPIIAITEAQMSAMTSTGLVIGPHNRSMHLGPVFDDNATVDTNNVKGVRIDHLGRVGINTATNVSHEYLTVKPIGSNVLDIAYRLNSSTDIRHKHYSDDGTYRGGFNYTRYANNTRYPNLHHDHYWVTNPSGTSTQVSMRLTREGYLLQQYIPAFGVAKTDNSNQIGSGVYVFNEVHFNNGSHYSTSNGRFTAPKSGAYFFCFSLQLHGANAVWARFQINGSDVFNNGTSSPIYEDGPDAHETLTHGMVLNLAQGDYVTVTRNNNTRGMQSSFCGHLLG